MPAITYATPSSSPFLQWLFYLLRDRKQLKELASKYRTKFAVHGRSRQTEEVQEEIVALVLSGCYDPRDHLKKISPEIFERLLFKLLEGYNQGWEWIPDIASFWNDPVSGLSVNLDPDVQLRLTELTAPLDEVVALAQDRFS